MHIQKMLVAKTIAIAAARILLILVCGSFVACGLSSDSPQSAPAFDAGTSPKTALRALAGDIWQEIVGNSTYFRLQDGLPIEKFEDLTLEEYHRRLARTAEFRTRLEKIDASFLAENDLITYEILAFELRDTGANDDDFWLTFDITSYVGPYYFNDAEQALAAQVISDRSSADQYLTLISEMADMIDHLIVKVEGQIERDIYLPRPALPAVRATWRGMQIALPAAIRVADERMAALSGREKAAFTTAVDTLIAERVEAGFDRLLTVLGDDYEVHAPKSVGLGQYPGGADVYRRGIENQTTLALTAQEIHERGKDAVDEILASMQAIRLQLEFDGTAHEFNEQIRSDSRFIAATPDEVEARYWEYIHRIEPKLGAYFLYLPEAAYGIRRLALAAEPGMTYGYYNPPTDADPVGYYNYNGSNLPDRSLVWAGSLIYHELLPGHHFQMAMQNENESLLEYRKKYWVSAFDEGWAEYAASLGVEMGLYDDPYDLYGHHIGELFLAVRLVVDTGMNALDWSLDDARDYMQKMLVQSEAEIASETLRYSTSIPAQALAYRLGYSKFWQLRMRAESVLGDKFDIREFHNVVLADGALPLPVLESKVDRWIAAQ